MNRGKISDIQYSNISYDVLYDILRKNHKFQKYDFFYNLLKNENKDNVDIVSHLIDNHAYYIFETLGTEDPLVYWGNMDIYFEDKLKALEYLWNYTIFMFNVKKKRKREYCIFRELLRSKFSRNHFKYVDNYNDYNDYKINVKTFIKKTILIKEKYEKKCEDIKELIYHDRTKLLDDIELLRSGDTEITFYFNYRTYDVKQTKPYVVVNFDADWIKQPSILMFLVSKLSNVDKNDYKLYLLYLFTRTYIKYNIIKHISSYERNITLIPVFFSIYKYIKNNHKNMILKLQTYTSKETLSENSKDFYLLLDVLVYIYYYRGVKPTISHKRPYGYSTPLDIYPPYLIIQNEANLELYNNKFRFIKLMVNIYKIIGRNEPLKLPEFLNELKYELKFKEYSILEIKVNDNEFIDPNKVLMRFGLKTTFDIPISYRVMGNVTPLLHELFGMLFIKNKIKKWNIKSSKTSFEYNISTDVRNKIALQLYAINHGLEAMFVEGTLDPKVFIPGIRLFNELYILTYIFPWIIRKKDVLDDKKFSSHLEILLKRLVFTSEIERNNFELLFKNKFKNKFKNITREKLNSFKKWTYPV